MTVEVNKSGVKGWHTIENSLTIQDVIEQYYEVSVYPIDVVDDLSIFEDIRDGVNQMYAGRIKEVPKRKPNIRLHRKG